MILLVIRRPSEISIKGSGSLIIKMKDSNKIIEKPLRDIDALLIIGKKVSISSSVPPTLSKIGIPLSIISSGHVSLLMNPIIVRNNNYRAAQYQMQKIKQLKVAYEYIKSKILGYRNLLRYYNIKAPKISFLSLDGMSDAEKCEEMIRIWEAELSATLWKNILKAIKGERLEVLRSKYGFNGRSPRHPDPFNKSLSVMYAVIYSIALKTLIAAGLDPTYGFLHRGRYNIPLVFDFSEMFKPVAVQATIALINRGKIPSLDKDGELTQEDVNKAIKSFYDFASMRNTATGKTVYQEIYIKSYCLASYLIGRCSIDKMIFIWDRKHYKRRSKRG